MRLAHEQQQQPIRFDGIVDQARDPPLRPLLDHQTHGYSRPAYPQGPHGVAHPGHVSYQNQVSFKVLNNHQQHPYQQQSHRQQHYQQQYQPQQQPLDYHSGINGENLRSHTRNYVESQQAYPRSQPTHQAAHVAPSVSLCCFISCVGCWQALICFVHFLSLAGITIA
jgi:hypothetical protein